MIHSLIKFEIYLIYVKSKKIFYKKTQCIVQCIVSMEVIKNIKLFILDIIYEIFFVIYNLYYLHFILFVTYLI